MSHPQAFHTSCRRGVTGSSGFQYNAVSAGLDEHQLARIAADHSGYALPPDAPAEPDPEQIARLPVTLRYLPVEGVGPVISRTAYVGREFRGAGGEPDSGRFGNYFSHIVVGDGDSGSAFGDLLPIELWEAPHWTTEEATATELPPLDQLEPGPLDPEFVLGRLRPSREDTLAVVADAALQAALGGPRVVVVEADPELAPAWVAWACFALPVDRVAELTFSTFDARPRMAESVRLCVTSPACDTAFSDYELGGSVTLVDTSSPPPVTGLSLYGRVLNSLLGDGAEAVTGATRAPRPGDDLDRLGAELAVSARRAALVAPAELPGVVAALTHCLGEIAPGELAAMVAELPAGEGTAEELAAWSGLYVAARGSDEAGAGGLVDGALERMLDSLADSLASLPAVEADSPSGPSAGVLARWLETVAAAAERGRLAAALEAGIRLGLIGCNTALDHELALLAAARFAEPDVQEAYARAARAGSAHFVDGVALALAEQAGAGGELELLRIAAQVPGAREAVRARAEEGGEFESVAAWEMLRAGPDGPRREAVAALARRAETAAHEATVRGLFGPDGPQKPREHVELVGGWAAAGAEAPVTDWEAALACLAGLSFRDSVEPAAKLFEALGSGPRAIRGDPDWIAWDLFFAARAERQSLVEWARDAVRLFRGGEPRLSEERAEELRDLAAAFAVRTIAADAQGRGVELLLREMDRDWAVTLGGALARRVANSVNPEKVLAGAFVQWHAPRKQAREALLERALPRAIGDLSPRRLEEVGARLPDSWLPEWEEWLEDHPPRRAVSRAVRGVLRKGEDR